MANSDEVIVDLTTYKDRVGSRVIPGRYRVRVEDAELDQTSKGDPMINVWLSVMGGEFEGATVIDRLLPQHPKALFRVVGFMQAIGLPTPKKKLRLNVRQFTNKILEVDIEDGDPYNGKVKSEVRGYYRIERQQAADLEDVTDPDAPEPDWEAMADEHSGSHLKDGPTEEDLADIEQMKGEVAASSEAARAQAAPVPDAAEEDGGYEPISLEDIDLT